MKALSLWQPWASLWLSPNKIHETRPRRTAHRGWLLVHAAKRIELQPSPDLREILEDEWGGHWSMDLPTGALIGRVFITDCVPLTPAVAVSDEDLACGDFSPGRWGYRRNEYEVFAKPIPYRGQQMLFDVPDEVWRGMPVWTKGRAA